MGAEQRLRGSGLRVTRPRVAVLEVLTDGGHLYADDVRHAVQTRLGSVSVQTVYDVLATLTSAGLLRRVEPAGSPALYEVRVGDNHHHMICRTCGAIEDVDCAAGLKPCLIPSTDHGFAVDEAEVTFWGTCPSCRRSTFQDHPRPTSPTSHTDKERHD
ncbi:MAG: Fur family transcriptional regulator [Nocardioidaceae bacterium]